MKKAVIITENKYPCEDAGAIRQHATAKILQLLGYDVFVAGYGAPTGNREAEFEGVKYRSFRPNSRNRFIRLIYRLSNPIRVMKYVRRHHSDAELLLVVDTLPYGYRMIASYAEKKGITLVHDSVEWYSPEEYANGEKNLEYRLKEAVNTKTVKGPWRVMAISTYLKEHFAKTCKAAVCIPVIMDTASIAYRTDSDRASDKLCFVYAGGPGWKDYIKEIVAGFSLLDKKELARVELHFIGISKQDLFAVCRVDEAHVEKLGSSLIAHGRVPHAEAVSWVKKADFTLLLRDASLRYAKAGFPTKIVESLSCGTPPICNLSSDLGLYLKDGENAFLVMDHSPEALSQTLRRVLSTATEERIAMRKNARKTAEEQFDYKKYVDVFRKLI